MTIFPLLGSTVETRLGDADVVRICPMRPVSINGVMRTGLNPQPLTS